MNTTSSSRQPLTLLPEPPTPNLPGSVVVRNSVPELVEEMGRDLLAHGLNCVRAFGDFHIALSAGNTPIPFYLHLMIDPTCRAIPWRKSHLWIVNEILNNQPAESPPNWNTIAGYFAEHAGIPDKQQHPITNQSLNPQNDYESELRQTLEWREKGHDRLDYVLLGVDEKGATAGLLPDNPVLEETTHLVARSTEPRRNDNITMTLPLINASRFIAVMVTGKCKQQIIRQLIRNNANSHPRNHPHLSQNTRTPPAPAQRIQPLAGILRWYLDKDACPEDS